MTKKKLILAVFFSVMLENIDAMDANANAQVMQQPQNQIVVINEVEYSQYNADENTIVIGDTKHWLDANGTLPNGVSLNYLRVNHVEEAVTLGLYNNVLFEIVHEPINMRGECRWMDYILYTYYGAARRLGLFDQRYLGEYVPFIFGKNGEHRLTWREYLAVKKAQHLPDDLLKIVCEPILESNLSNAAIYIANNGKIVAQDSELKLKEYFAIIEPIIAKKLGVFTSDFLKQNVPQCLIEKYHLKQSTWREHFYYRNEGNLLLALGFDQEFAAFRAINLWNGFPIMALYDYLRLRRVNYAKYLKIFNPNELLSEAVWRLLGADWEGKTWGDYSSRFVYKFVHVKFPF